MLLALLTFIAGAAIEMACVFWVHNSERGRARATAICSGIIGTAQVYGIGESIRLPVVAVAYVSGYVTGTYCAVRWKAWLLEHVERLALRMGRASPTPNATDPAGENP